MIHSSALLQLMLQRGNYTPELFRSMRRIGLQALNKKRPAAQTDTAGRRRPTMARTLVCQACGASFKERKPEWCRRGRIRRFCSNRCRQKQHRRRKKFAL